MEDDAGHDSSRLVVHLISHGGHFLEIICRREEGIHAG